MRKTVFTALTLTTLLLLTPSAQADQVHLINGDIINGEIGALQDGAGLNIWIDNGQIVNIPWKNVAGIYGDTSAPTITRTQIQKPPAEEKTPASSVMPLPEEDTSGAPIPLNTEGLEVKGLSAVPLNQSEAKPVRHFRYASAPFLSTPRRPRLQQWGSSAPVVPPTIVVEVEIEEPADIVEEKPRIWAGNS